MINLPGHVMFLHISVVVDWPEQFAPWASTVVLILDLVKTPDPHDLLQLPLVQSPHWQFTKFIIRCSIMNSTYCTFNNKSWNWFDWSRRLYTWTTNWDTCFSSCWFARASSTMSFKNCFISCFCQYAWTACYTTATAIPSTPFTIYCNIIEI